MNVQKRPHFGSMISFLALPLAVEQPTELSTPITRRYHDSKIRRFYPLIQCLLLLLTAQCKPSIARTSFFCFPRNQFTTDPRALYRSPSLHPHGNIPSASVSPSVRIFKDITIPRRHITLSVHLAQMVNQITPTNTHESGFPTRTTYSIFIIRVYSIFFIIPTIRWKIL